MYEHYERLGGWLLFFIVCQIFLLAFVVLELLGIGFVSLLPNDLLFIQFINLVAVASPCFCIYYTIKKSRNSLLGIRKFLISNSFGWALMIVLFFVTQIHADYHYRGISPVYILTLVNSAIWSMYFKRSKRVAVYFGLFDSKSSMYDEFDNNILNIENPIEQEIIDALAEKGAISKETAVLPDDLSVNILFGQYAFVTYNLLYLEKRIGMIQGKYYLSDVKKGEYTYGLPIKFYKVIVGILIGCALLALVALALIFLDEKGII